MSVLVSPEVSLALNYSDAALAIRLMRKQPFLTLTAILALATGIGGLFVAARGIFAFRLPADSGPWGPACGVHGDDHRRRDRHMGQQGARFGSRPLMH